MSEEFEMSGNDLDGWNFRFIFGNGREIFLNNPNDPYATRQKCLQGIGAARQCFDAPIVQIMPDGSRVTLELPETPEPVDEQAEEAIMRQANPAPFEEMA